jgi:hypothetical protein
MRKDGRSASKTRVGNIGISEKIIAFPPHENMESFSNRLATVTVFTATYIKPHFSDLT